MKDSEARGKPLEPRDVSDAAMAFPARVVGTLLPDEDKIPKGYEHERYWRGVQSDWFFKGLPDEFVAGLVPKSGIDKTKALRHLAACQGSFQPQHQHKQAGVSYLLSLWFEAAQ